MSELSHTFLMLQRENPKDTRICIFIDGLDEYEEDHYDIVEFLNWMST